MSAKYSLFEFLKPCEIKPRGWLKEYLLVESEGYLPLMDRICPEIYRKPFVNKVFIGTGPKIKEEIELLIWGDGEHFGYWIDAMVRLAHSIEDKSLTKKVSNIINEIIENQDDDGYIGLFPKHDPYRWTDACSELWPQALLYTAMLAYYDFTKDTRVWNSLLAAASLTSQQFDYGKNWAKYTENTHAIMIVEPMLDLYSRTRDPRFLDFAVNAVKYNIEDDPYLKGVLEGKLSGHGVHVIEHLRIPAMIYAYIGEINLLKASLNSMTIIENEYLNSNWAPKSDEWIDGGAAPNKAVEYCTIVEWMLTTSQLVAITGNVKYADLEERCVYNAAMGARRTDGKGIQYLSFPNQIEASRGEWHGEYAFRPNHFPLCCNPQAGRLMPYHLVRSWMKTSNGTGLAAVFYIPCEVRTVIGADQAEVIIREETNYPFNEYIKFIINLEFPTKFDLFLRIPLWSENPSLKINGIPFRENVKPGCFAKVSRTWNDGDVVELLLPTRLELKKDKFNLISINYGPFVFSLPIPYKVFNFDRAGYGLSAQGYEPLNDARWNYALIVDEKNLEKSLKIVKLDPSQYPASTYPWEVPSILLKVKGQLAPEWKVIPAEGVYAGYDVKKITHYLRAILGRWPEPLEKPLKEALKRKNISGGVTCDIPHSPLEPSGEVEELMLVPYGFTKLRITSFPYVRT